MAAASEQATGSAAEGRAASPNDGHEAVDDPDGPEISVAVSVHSHHLILGIVIGAFLVSLGIFLFMFRAASGDEIVWKKQLSAIDMIHDEGRFAEAAEQLAKFGEDWPGARDTFEWNRKMGQYHADAGDLEAAATWYVRAAEIEPDKPGIHALAGEALWKAGRRDDAVKHLAEEIRTINRATGDHDRANYYLGLHLLEQKKYPEAMQHFQAISDRKRWEKELAEVKTRIDTELIAPAREQAKALPADAIP